MKGVVFNLLEAVVRRDYGDDTWEALLEAAVALDGLVALDVVDQLGHRRLGLLHLAQQLVEPTGREHPVASQDAEVALARVLREVADRGGPADVAAVGLSARRHGFDLALTASFGATAWAALRGSHWLVPFAAIDLPTGAPGLKSLGSLAALTVLGTAFAQLVWWKQTFIHFPQLGSTNRSAMWQRLRTEHRPRWLMRCSPSGTW